MVREQVRGNKLGECSFCMNPATTKAWGSMGYGPGGGIDAIWKAVPACQRCAGESWGDRGLQYPHTLPPNAGPTRKCL